MRVLAGKKDKITSSIVNKLNHPQIYSPISTGIDAAVVISPEIIDAQK